MEDAVKTCIAKVAAVQSILDEASEELNSGVHLRLCNAQKEAFDSANALTKRVKHISQGQDVTTRLRAGDLAFEDLLPMLRTPDGTTNVATALDTLAGDDDTCDFADEVADHEWLISNLIGTARDAASTNHCKIVIAKACGTLVDSSAKFSDAFCNCDGIRMASDFLDHDDYGVVQQGVWLVKSAADNYAHRDRCVANDGPLHKLMCLLHSESAVSTRIKMTAMGALRNIATHHAMAQRLICGHTAFVNVIDMLKAENRAGFDAGPPLQLLEQIVCYEACRKWLVDQGIIQTILELALPENMFQWSAAISIFEKLTKVPTALAALSSAPAAKLYAKAVGCGFTGTNGRACSILRELGKYDNPPFFALLRDHGAPKALIALVTNPGTHKYVQSLAMFALEPLCYVDCHVMRMHLVHEHGLTEALANVVSDSALDAGMHKQARNLLQRLAMPMPELMKLIDEEDKRLSTATSSKRKRTDP